MHWIRLEETILRKLTPPARNMTPDEQAMTMLVIRIGLVGILAGVLGTGLLVFGAYTHGNLVTTAGAILDVVASALLVVAIAAAAFHDISRGH